MADSLGFSFAFIHWFLPDDSAEVKRIFFPRGKAMAADLSAYRGSSFVR